MFKSILTVFVVLMLFSQSFSYDKERAKENKKFFTAFSGKNVGKAMQLECPKTLLKKMKMGEKFCFLDIRTKAEIKIAGITYENTIEVEMDKVFNNSTLDKLPTDVKIIVVCAKNNRAIAIAIALRQTGFSNVMVLKGGLNALAANLGPAQN